MRWRIVKQNGNIISRECTLNFVRFSIPKEKDIWMCSVKEMKKLIRRVTIGFKTKQICSVLRQSISLCVGVNGIAA
jgi:hypothetical protein